MKSRYFLALVLMGLLFSLAGCYPYSYVRADVAGYGEASSVPYSQTYAYYSGYAPYAYYPYDPYYDPYYRYPYAVYYYPYPYPYLYPYFWSVHYGFHTHYYPYRVIVSPPPKRKFKSGTAPSNENSSGGRRFKK